MISFPIWPRRTKKSAPIGSSYRPAVEALEPRVVLDAAPANDTAFVNSLYTTLLHRPPDAASAANFVSMLDQGQATRGEVVEAFLNSAEYENGLVNALFVQFLKRAPDAAGLATDVQFLTAGGSDLQLQASILGSSEFFTDNGATNTGFLNGVYNQILHRPLDAAGGQFWMSQLAAGATREQVAFAIITSPEGFENLVEGYFTSFLHRPADPAGLSSLTQDLLSGASDQSVIASILGSPEFAPLDPPVQELNPADSQALTADQVSQLLERAAAASSRTDAIIAVVDRSGQILGVRVESGVAPSITGNVYNLVFAIDGAIAEARTGAMFSSDQGALTSRTIQFISQTTITQREVDSNPDYPVANSPLEGPGFVAPIGIGGHFPPGIANTTSADLFQIEGTNRDSIINDGPDGIRGTADDVVLPARFNINPVEIPDGARMSSPESYGFVSGILPDAQARGIGTLPGGVPIYENGILVGGIGVFFPGTTGYATSENSALSAGYNPNLPDLSEVAEWMAFAAGGGTLPSGGFNVGTLGGVPDLPGVGIPAIAQINLGGIALPVIGPGGSQGPYNLMAFGAKQGTGNPNDGANQPLFPGDHIGVRPGMPAPEGWLAYPQASLAGGLTQAEVIQMIEQGVQQAEQTRAQIRALEVNTEMVIAVSDSQGNIVGMYRMADAPIFSEDVAVAKARNSAYYDNPAELQPADQLAGLPSDVAMTARDFRELAQPFFPEGIDGTQPGPWSVLNDPGTNPTNGLSSGPALPPSDFLSELGFAAFHPETNFNQPWSLNQNGVVFFPGSSALYVPVNGVQTIVGGLGASGDGVNQDDLITDAASTSFQPPAALQADNFSFRGVQLPYYVFPRNPEN